MPEGSVHVSRTDGDAGSAAGRAAAEILRGAIARKGSARVVFASAPSQEAMLAALTSQKGIDWSKVESLHLDEYVGIDPSHSASFGQWLASRLPQPAHEGLRRINSLGSTTDEIDRYTTLLKSAEIDLVCLGIGVNGHIAFNEPGDTDFEDPALLREVPLTHESRQQQVDEGLFETLGQVPTQALSMTVPAIMAGKALVCTVLGESKARAVRQALTEPVTTDVPSSILQTHSAVSVFLDASAARDLDEG